MVRGVIMEKVYTLKEAEVWFLSHSNGSVMCVKDGAEKEVNCYPDAVTFYVHSIRS